MQAACFAVAARRVNCSMPISIWPCALSFNVDRAQWSGLRQFSVRCANIEWLRRRLIWLLHGGDLCQQGGGGLLNRSGLGITPSFASGVYQGRCT